MIHEWSVPDGHKVTMTLRPPSPIDVVCSCGVRDLWAHGEDMRDVQRRLDRHHFPGDLTNEVHGPDPRLIAVIAERLRCHDTIPEAAEDIAAAVWAWLTEGDEL